MTPTSMTLIGHHTFASFMSKSRNEIIPSLFTVNTHATQTDDCMHSRRKFMLKWVPDTTNCIGG